MSLKAIVVSSGKKASRKISFDEYNIVDTLGEAEIDLGVRVDEIVRAVSESVQESISTDSELTVEITGSVSLKGEAGVKWLLINLGGSGTDSECIKVILKTTIRPAPRENVP